MRLSMFLRCSYFLAKSEADVLINSVRIKRKACIDRRPFLTADLDSWGQNWFSMGWTVKSQNFDMVLRFSSVHNFYHPVEIETNK